MKLLIQKISQWKWANQNPKRFFIYVMVFLGISLVVNILLEVFVEKPKKSVLFPSLYTKSDQVIDNQSFKDEQLKAIFEELKLFENKRNSGTLTANDSLRIEFLYQKYQELKQ